MLIPFGMLSQEESKSLKATDSTTVSLEYLQDVDFFLRKLETCRAESKLNDLIIEKYKSAADKFERTAKENKLEAQTWKRSFEIMEGLYEAEKLTKPKSNWFGWLLGSISAFLAGYFIGAVF